MGRIEEVVAAKTVISAKISQAYMDKVDAFLEKRTDGLKRSSLVVAALDLFMSGAPAPAATAENTELVTELRAQVAELEGRLATAQAPKKPATVRPLTARSGACWRVLQAVALCGNAATSSEVAELMDRSINYVGARLSELAANGYIEPTGEKRQSKTSTMKLPVMRLTMKPLPQ